MISLTIEEIQQIQKAEAIAFANWLSNLSYSTKTNKSVENLYDEFKQETEF